MGCSRIETGEASDVRKSVLVHCSSLPFLLPQALSSLAEAAYESADIPQNSEDEEPPTYALSTSFAVILEKLILTADRWARCTACVHVETSGVASCRNTKGVCVLHKWRAGEHHWRPRLLAAHSVAAVWFLVLVVLYLLFAYHLVHRQDGNRSNLRNAAYEALGELIKYSPRVSAHPSGPNCKHLNSTYVVVSTER